MNWLQRQAEKIVDWFVRPMTLARGCISSGVALIVGGAAAGGFVVAVRYVDPDGELSATVSSGGIELLSWLIFLAGIALIVFGVCRGAAVERLDLQDRQRKRVFVIEQRGLRDTSSSPLEDALPRRIVGRRESVPIDIRQRIEDGKVTDPKAALAVVEGCFRDFSRRQDGLSAKDIEVVYGGLMPVPFAFLSGALMDDEGRIESFDWDREKDAWRPLTDVDDGDRFTVTALDEASGTDVVVAISVSYEADQKALAATFGTLPIVEMKLPHINADNHWSADKQAALAKQFLEVIKKLGARSAERIHVVAACQNSMAFRLGRSYDRRNLPSMTIYQYERKPSPHYAWGVRLPDNGRDLAEIVGPPAE